MPDLRDRLVDAGVARLERDGLAGLTLRAVTRDAGVSHGAPRRHFDTFAGLLAAIADRGIADLETEVRPALERSGPIAARIAAAVDAYLGFADRRPDMFALLFRHDLLEVGGHDLRARSLPILDALAAVVAEAGGGDGAARDTALAIWTQAHGVAALGRTGALDLAATPDERSRLVHAAVRAHLSSAP